MIAGMSDSKTTPKARLQHSLRRDILTLVLAPGQDLDEMALCAQYGVSRTPLREVLRELAGEGYLQLREHRGAQVSALDHTTLRSFFAAAPMIYGAVLELAAQHASAAQILDLEQAQQRFEEALANGAADERTLTNQRFHEITGEMTGNSYLRPSFGRLLIDHARIGMRFYHKDDKAGETQEEASAQHRAIIDAIRCGDSQRARCLANAHWELSRHQIARYVMPSPLDIPLGRIAP